MAPDAPVPLVELDSAAGSPIVIPEEPPTLVVWPAELVVIPVSPSIEVEPSSLTEGRQWKKRMAEGRGCDLSDDRNRDRELME